MRDYRVGYNSSPTAIGQVAKTPNDPPAQAGGFFGGAPSTIEKDYQAFQTIIPVKQGRRSLYEVCLPYCEDCQRLEDYCNHHDLRKLPGNIQQFKIRYRTELISVTLWATFLGKGKSSWFHGYEYGAVTDRFTGKNVAFHGNTPIIRS